VSICTPNFDIQYTLNDSIITYFFYSHQTYMCVRFYNRVLLNECNQNKMFVRNINILFWLCDYKYFRLSRKLFTYTTCIYLCFSFYTIIIFIRLFNCAFLNLDVPSFPFFTYNNVVCFVSVLSTRPPCSTISLSISASVNPVNTTTSFS